MLSNNVIERQGLIDELRSSARPLIATCDPEVVRRITETIQAAETTWTDTNDNLRDLRDRYRRAVELWAKYREYSDVIRHWADDQMNGIGCVKPLDVSDIEVCQMPYTEDISYI